MQLTHKKIFYQSIKLNSLSTESTNITQITDSLRYSSIV